MTNLIRRIRVEDNHAVASIIRTVMPEFGAGGAGFAIHDKEVDDMFSAYSGKRSAYFVCELEGRIVGGGGIAQLEGADPKICELKKMYFLQDGRGKGLGEQLLNNCLTFAKDAGYSQCYLETFNTMNKAMALYERMGFDVILGPMGNTGHFACDVFYLKNL